MACLSIGTLQTQRRPAYQKGKQKLQKLMNFSAVYRKRKKRTDYVDNMSILTSNFFEDISHVTKELDYSQITKMYVSNASRCL